LKEGKQMKECKSCGCLTDRLELITRSFKPALVDFVLCRDCSADFEKNLGADFVSYYSFRGV
jgi:hypothetical protein